MKRSLDDFFRKTISRQTDTPTHTHRDRVRHITHTHTHTHTHSQTHTTHTHSQTESETTGPFPAVMLSKRFILLGEVWACWCVFTMPAEPMCLFVLARHGKV